eukprot:m51a1_g3419 hypothetical protein (290) ;mRNA; f:585922-587412
MKTSLFPNLVVKALVLQTVALLSARIYPPAAILPGQLSIQVVSGMLKVRLSLERRKKAQEKLAKTIRRHQETSRPSRDESSRRRTVIAHPVPLLARLLGETLTNLGFPAPFAAAVYKPETRRRAPPTSAAERLKDRVRAAILTSELSKSVPYLLLPAPKQPKTPPQTYHKRPLEGVNPEAPAAKVRRTAAPTVASPPSTPQRSIMVLRGDEPATNTLSERTPRESENQQEVSVPSPAGSSAVPLFSKVPASRAAPQVPEFAEERSHSFKRSRPDEDSAVSGPLSKRRRT